MTCSEKPEDATNKIHEGESHRSTETKGPADMLVSKLGGMACGLRLHSGFKASRGHQVVRTAQATTVRKAYVHCTLFTSLRLSRLGKLKAHVKARVKKERL